MDWWLWLLTRVDNALDAVSPLLPSAVGAFVGLRYRQPPADAKEQRSRRDHALSWICAMAAGIYLGAAIGEYFGLSLKVVGGLMFVIAMFASEIAAAAIAALRQWAADPAGTFRRWVDAILGRGT